MSKIRNLGLGLLAAMGIGLFPANPASASLVFDSSILLGAQGFGNAPRDLTIQRTGRITSPESGCVGVSGTGTIVIGGAACISDALVNAGNGVTNIGGDEPNPQADNQKYGIPTASSLGITDASQIGVLFNATEPSGDAADVTDLTLKFYSTLTDSLLGAIDGNQSFLSTNPGNGVAGFVFVVDAAELAYVNGILGTGDVFFALESTLTGTSGGPESFLIANLTAPPPGVPEPSTLSLFGLGVAGLSILMRRRRQKQRAS